MIVASIDPFRKHSQILGGTDPSNPVPKTGNQASKTQPGASGRYNVDALRTFSNTGSTDTTIIDTDFFDTDDDDKKGGGGGSWGGYNYAPQINALLESGRRAAPTLLNQYIDSAGNLIKDKDAANDLYNDNVNLAYDTYKKNMIQQNRLNDDAWYLFYQKLNNWEALNNTQINTGRYGSLDTSLSGLANISHDQFNQQNLANMRAGQQGYYQTLMDNVNQNRNAQRQNELDVASQLRNLQLQYKSSVSDFLNQITANLAGYSAGQYVDNNGKITNAGWDYINQLGLGVTNDGKGGFNIDTSVLNPEGSTLDEIIANLGNKQNAPFITADYYGPRRSLEETNKTFQDRSDTIDRTRSNKTLASSNWSTLVKRYG